MQEEPTNPPAAPVSLVETDAFCDCGYNLHGQIVWRDERLGLLVCRCPECAKHSAAGRFTGIHSAWLHRLSLTLILTWSAFLLGWFLFLSIMLGVWPSAYVQSGVEMMPIPNTGPNQTIYQYDLRSANRWDEENGRTFTATMFGFASLNALIIGITAGSFMWHLKWRTYLTLILPLLAVAFVHLIWSTSSVSDQARHWIHLRIATFAAIECAMIVLGILAGRPVARFVLKMLLPSRLLQHLAFLWYRDGKTLELKGKF
jgi:hypothetical protein